MPAPDAIHEKVTKYYSEKARKTDVAGPTTCLFDGLGAKVNIVRYNEAVAKLNPILAKQSYGCGVPFPPLLDGCKVLDLGSGKGKDVFILSYLVGSSGSITGVDMTPAMVDGARSLVKWHEAAFGYGNVDFKQGFLEDLGNLDLEPESFDLIVSNCVICLCADKKAVLTGALKLLKPGGEMYFSDLFADKPVPAHLRSDDVAYNEGYSSSLSVDECSSLVKEIGYAGPFVVETLDYPVRFDQLKSELENHKFWSKTIRLIKPKVSSDETAQAMRSVTYKGTICDNKSSFLFDKEHVFKANEASSVPAHIGNMLEQSRYGQHFMFE